MRPGSNWLCGFACLFFAPALFAQSLALASGNQNAAAPAPTAPAAEVPRLIKFGGTLLDAQDRPLAGPVGVTFALHAQQTGGAALWIETQNVTPDAHGNYTVLLGANSTNGVPAELFASGEARWLEVQVERQAEQPRILLVSVPYALKAKDAETLGGRPASAFLTTETLAGAGSSSGSAAAASTVLPSSKTQTTPKKTSSAAQPAVACTSVTSDGTATVNSIALFTAPCAVQSSVITESGAKVGIGTAAPAVALDIVGNNAGMRLSGTGTHQVTVTGASSGRLGQDSTGFFFSSDSNGKVIKFLTNNGTLNEWMRITSAGNVGIGTTTPGAKLEIAGGNLALPNTTSGGTAGVITLGGLPFLHNFGMTNTFVGAQAGNMTATGFGHNTAVGSSALGANTSGAFNSAFGYNALLNNSTGGANSAVGLQALEENTTGSKNSAFGIFALQLNTTGGNNSAFGDAALENLTGGNNNIAIGDLAGSSLTGLESNNIYIGNAGVASESNIIRIGSTQTATFLAGTIMGNLSGNATNFTGSLGGEVTGTQGATVVSNAVTPNTANAIVRRDASGNFSAGSVTLSGQLVSTVATGVAPLMVNSLSQVTNLNAQFLGGFPPAAFAALAGGNNFTGNQSVTGNVSLTGNLGLPNTTSGTVGVITLGGTPFAHNFGLDNTFIGQNAGNLTMTGPANTASGFQALLSNTTGCCNTASGFNALQNNTTGSQNTASGLQALQNNTTGLNNTASGSGALDGNTTGSDNTATGFTALQNNTFGDLNTATGSGALSSSTFAGANTATGYHALYTTSTGGLNTATGSNALLSNTTGIQNTASGESALRNNTTGSNNTGTGESALSFNTTGSNNTAIGTFAGVSTGNLTNTTAIGYNVQVNTSNKIRLGDSNVSVIEGQVAYTFTSDKNQKENFQPVEGEQVLRKIGGLTLASWNYIGHDPKQFRHYGPVAQEFFGAFGHDAIGTIGTSTTINSGDMDGILMVAVQALYRLSLQKDAEIRKLQAQSRKLAAEVAQLRQTEASEVAENQMQSIIARQQAEMQDLAARLAKLEALVSPAP